MSVPLVRRAFLPHSASGAYAHHACGARAAEKAAERENYGSDALLHRRRNPARSIGWGTSLEESLED